MSQVFDAYAAYYDLLYRDKNYAEEARYVQSLLARHGVTQGSLLELGCGTGRHAEQLARLGYSIRGIDLSPGMVDQAKKRAPADLAGQLGFEVGDARKVRLSAQFDAVICLFHVASYQTTNEDLSALFASAAAHLQPGGLFVFDFWYGPGVLTDPPAVRVKHLEDNVIRVTRIAEPTLHPNENLVDVHYTVLIKASRTGALSELQETHRMRYLFLPELRFLLQAAGMEMVQAEEWLSMKDPGLGSWQAVVTARRLSPDAK
jgi:SAM-dependent methyltransferase